MFRGGRVDSYGTGIASGLATGGRVGLYRGGSLSYNPFQQSQTSNLLGRNTPKVLPQMQGGNIFAPVQITESGFSKYDPGRSIRESQPMYEEFAEISEEMPAANIIASADEGFIPQSLKDKMNADVEADLPISIIDNSPKEVKTPKINETEDETEVTMTDLEKALGLDKAKRRDLGDMLGRASAAFLGALGRASAAFLGAGDVREGLAEFMAAETKAGPSRTERIKSIAGLEEFKAKKAQELYEAKLTATLKQKAGTKGSLQKDIEYLGTLTGADRIAALGKLGYKAPSLSAAIKELKLDGQAPDGATIINLATLYIGPDFQGVVDVTEEMSGKSAGTYITTDATALIIVDEKGNTRLQKL
jgi:hypothetical protein